jgi:hypothetical protein
MGEGSNPNNQTAKRRAPVVPLVAIAVGAIWTMAASLVVVASNPDGFWPAAGIGALNPAHPSVFLGTGIFVLEPYGYP